MKKLIIAYNYLKRYMKDRVGMLIMLIMPLAFTVMMGTTMEGVLNQEIKRFEILYVNEDNGELGRQFDSFIRSDTISEMFSVKEAAMEEVKGAMEDGSHSAAIIVEDTFTSDVLSGRDADIRVIELGDNVVENSIVNGAVDGFARGINQSITGFKPEGTGVVKEVVLESPGQISAMQYFASSMLVMFMLFAGTMGASYMIREREGHTLMRTMAAPVREFDILAGNFLGNTFTAMIQAALIISITSMAFGVKWGSSISGIILTTAAVVFVSSSLAFLFSMVVKSEKMADGIITVIMLLMSFLSGSFVPLDGTGALDTLSHFTINRWAFDSYQEIMTGGNLGSIYQNLLVLVVIGCVFMMISVILFKRRGSLYE